MGYKSKTCPKCGVTHNKRGEFCSRSCGNTRAHTKESKQAISDAKKEWHATSEIAAVVAHNYTSLGNNKVADPVAPIVSRDIGHNRFVEDGDLWEEVQLLSVEGLCGAMSEGYVAHLCGCMCMWCVSALERCNIAI